MSANWRGDVFVGTTAALIMGGLAAAGSIGGGVLQSHAAKTAAQQQTESAQKAIDLQKQIFETQQANQAPYLAAGTTSLAKLMESLSNGTFGPGSLGPLPGAPPEAPGPFTERFKAPTLEEARATPGYEFTRTQGEKGILQGAAAAGGAISGGTLKRLDQYNTGLADTTYGDVFNRSLQTYGAGVTAYNTNLANYQAQLNRYAESLGGFQVGQSAKAQEFGQLFAPVQLGEGSVQSVNQTGSQAATNIGNLMTQIGNSQAAGTVGSANAISGGISGASNSIIQSLLFNQLFGGGGGSGGGPPSATLSQLIAAGMAGPAAGGPGH